MTIIISKNGKGAKKIDSASFDYENNLQEYIDDNPNSIPMYEIKEDARVLVLAREFSTNSGPIDALGIDQDGEIYIIETKLYKNSDKRTVCAQALDYGASLWKSAIDFSDFVLQIDNYLFKKEGINCSEKIRSFYDLEEAESLLNKIKDNLNNGNFKFIVLMDHLDSRLKDLILFINENSKFDIYAVEFEYYKYEEMEIIIPKLYGAEVKKSILINQNSSSRRTWNEDSFWQDAESRLAADQLQALHKLYEFAQKNADEITWGTGSICGSFNPKHHHICPRSFFTFFSNGSMTLNFGYLNDDGQRNKLLKMMESSSFASSFNITKDLIHSYPVLKADIVTKHQDEIIDIWQNFIS